LHKLVGGLDTMAILLYMVQTLQDEEDGALEIAPEELERVRGHLRVAMTLPAEQREGLLGALALVELLRGDNEAAFRVAEEAIQRGEWDYGAVSVGLMAMTGLSLEELFSDEGPDFLEDPRVSETLARWLEALQPETPEAWASLGQMRADREDWEGALPPIQRARELAPQTAKYALAEGITLLKLGHAQEAVEPLERSLDLAEGDEELQPQAEFAYSMALLAAGLGDEAEE